MIRVVIPSPLRSYTDNASPVLAPGRTIAEVLTALDTRHPGIRFRMIDEQDRIRPHIRFFVKGEMASALEHAVADGDELMIVCALSGG